MLGCLENLLNIYYFTIISLLAPKVIQQLLLLSTFLSIFFVIGNAANYKNYKTRKKRWRHHKKKARRFRHRRLPYHLVQ